MIGRRLGHYLITEHIGSGGMGDVYLARDTKLDRNVAIKILPQAVNDEPERMRRFEQEAKAASALDHPNVVHIYEIGDSDGIRFIAMQYVQGEPLSNQIKNGPLPVERLLDIGISVADALQEAHTKGVVHRDIKPANILITPRGQSKVVDFGLAKIFREPDNMDDLAGHDTPTTTKSGMILGTVHYMSPEQALGKPADHRSDIFSFGAVLYQMASSRLPFEGLNSIEMISNILKSDPKPLTSQNGRLPAALEAVIFKCLEKDPAKRYQTAGELSADLRAIQQDKMTSAASTIRLRPARPVRRALPFLLLALVAAGIVFVVFRMNVTSTPIDSIAVLPLGNPNKNTDLDFLSDGITDSVITSLSQLPQLRVMARSTVFSYKDRQIDPRTVGRDLHVRAILTGDIARVGDHVSIHAELVDAKDGSLLWTNRYLRNVTNLVGVQEDIAQDISQKLKLKLTGEQQRRLGKHYTENAEAYEAYLKGLYYLNKRTDEGFKKAIESFQYALSQDPNYALAYAGLADCYTLMPSWALMPPSEGHPKAKEAATKALSLDNSLAEAHSALAHTLHNYDLNWQESGREYQRAIELNPGYATAHHWNAWMLVQDREFEAGIEEIQRALELDPFSLVTNADYGYLLFLSGQQPRAIEQLNKTVDLDPKFALTHEYLGYVLEVQKQYDRELREFEKASAAQPESLEIKAEVARAMALNGNRAKAEETLRELLDSSTDRYVVAFDIAMLYDALGDKKQTYEWLQKAYDEHSYQISGLAVDPRLNHLRKDPEFITLLNHVKRK